MNTDNGLAPPWGNNTIAASCQNQLMRPTPDDLAVAPELGILAALDAVLATATHQLLSENPDLSSLIIAANGELPSHQAIKANALLSDFYAIRRELRRYYVIAIGGDDDNEIDF